MNRKQALQFVKNIEEVETLKFLLRECIGRAPEKVTVANTWQYHAKRFLAWIESGMDGKPPFKVFMPKGNGKLPFVAFSSLALADCPGKGDCQKWCYSLKAWRYPAAFFRQVQNSLLLRFNPIVIEESFRAIKHGLQVRLFVDGDFKDVATLERFMDLCHERPDLSVYGYSKSWKEFVMLNASGYKFPSNYVLNASSGSKHEGTGIQNAFMKIDVIRGEFVAVPVPERFIASKAYQDKANPGSKEYRKTVAEKLKAFSNKVFACPGNCGNCLPRGRHACGSKDFEGVTIGIGIHA